MSIPALMPMIAQLISTPSVSSINPHWDQTNEGVIAPLADWFAELGFKTEVLPVPGHPGKSNLIASAGSGPEGLLLAGHTDTVPYDDDRWSHNPFSLTQKDNRIYGLGTSDMKAFFALIIEATRELDLKTLKRPLTILATADEESNMCGAQALVDINKQLGRHAIIGEPTGLKPVRMHKGIAMETIRVHGKSGHSSNPALGANAMEGMYLVIGEVLKWRADLQQRYHNPMFEVAVPTINLGHIHGGDNPNRICASCDLQFDIRPLPGMDLTELRGELNLRLKQLQLNDKLQLEMLSPFNGVPPMETPAMADIVKASEALTGFSAGSVAFGTEAPYLQQLGMETVILGPGDIDQAHQPDEYLGLERIEPMITLLKSLIKKFCL